MTIRNFFMLTIISLFCLVTSIHGHAQELFDQEEMTEKYVEKTYISPERIFIHPEGIFFMNDVGDVIPARLIGSNSLGIYAVAFYQCPACGRMSRDNICLYPRCPKYGW